MATPDVLNGSCKYEILWNIDFAHKSRDMESLHRVRVLH